MKGVGFIFAFIATKLFWTLSWCKTVSYYTYFRVRIHVCQLWLYTLEVAGSFAGRLPIKYDPHWLRRAETTNENREARLPCPPGSKLGPGRLSITSKIFVQQDSNLRNPAICWFRAWLCQPASPDYPQIKSFRLYINRHKILKRSNTGSTTFSSTT